MQLWLRCGRRQVEGGGAEDGGPRNDTIRIIWVSGIAIVIVEHTADENRGRGGGATGLAEESLGAVILDNASMERAGEAEVSVSVGEIEVTRPSESCF